MVRLGRDDGHVVVRRVGVVDASGAEDASQERFRRRDTVQVPGDERHAGTHTEEGNREIQPRLAPGDQGYRGDERRDDQDPSELVGGAGHVGQRVGDLFVEHGGSPCVLSEEPQEATQVGLANNNRVLPMSPTRI